MNRNIAVYINVAVMGNVNEVLSKILKRMQESGLTDSASRIVLAVCGDITSLVYEPNDKYQVTHVSQSVDQYEFPALSKMWHDSRVDDELKLYIHTKGVSRNNPFVSDWVEFLSYFNIDLWKERLNELEHNDCTGVNLKGNPADIHTHPSWWGYGKAPLHYSGNFWWTKSSHVRTLPEPYSWAPDNELGRWRMMPEMWVCSNVFAKYNNAFSSDVDHYQSPYPKSIYESTSR